MGKTASDVLIDTLQSWGVDVIFGLPGDGINGIMESLRQRQDDLRFVQVRHEESAAFMACAYAKYTGKLGVCLATSGLGGLHLLNGLYDAKLDGQPVLAITGHHYHDLIGTYAQRTSISIASSRTWRSTASASWGRRMSPSSSKRSSIPSSHRCRRRSSRCRPSISRSRWRKASRIEKRSR